MSTCRYTERGAIPYFATVDYAARLKLDEDATDFLTEVIDQLDVWQGDQWAKALEKGGKGGGKKSKVSKGNT